MALLINKKSETNRIYKMLSHYFSIFSLLKNLENVAMFFILSVLLFNFQIKENFLIECEPSTFC